MLPTAQFVHMCACADALCLQSGEQDRCKLLVNKHKEVKRKKNVSPYSESGQISAHDLRQTLVGNKSEQARISNEGWDYSGLAYSSVRSKTAGLLGETSSIHHSYLVAAALQAHPSPFPARCRRICSKGSVLINLITNVKMDPRPIHLSAKPYRASPCLCFKHSTTTTTLEEPDGTTTRENTER